MFVTVSPIGKFDTWFATPCLRNLLFFLHHFQFLLVRSKLRFFIVQNPTFPFHNPTNPLTLAHLGLYRPYSTTFCPKNALRNSPSFFPGLHYLLQISTFPFHLHFLRNKPNRPLVYSGIPYHVHFIFNKKLTKVPCI